MVEPDRSQITIQYGAPAPHAGQLRLQKHSQNKWYFLLYHANNAFANAPQCYVYTYTACLVYNLFTTFQQFLHYYLQVLAAEKTAVDGTILHTRQCYAT